MKNWKQFKKNCNGENYLKTIIHVLPYMAEGGTEKHVLTLMRALRNHYNLILLAPRGEILDEFLKLDVSYYEFPDITLTSLQNIKVYKNTLAEIHNKYQIDIVHVHAAHEFVKFTKKILPNTPIIFHLSAHQGSTVSKFINYKLSAFISKKNAQTLIAVSDEEKRIITDRGFPDNRVTVVYNGYESREGDDYKKIQTITKKHGLEGSLIIGNLGRLHKTKRLDILIKAFDIVQHRLNDRRIKMLIIGDGPEKRRLEKLVLKKRLQNEVLFLGFVKRGDRILKIFDIFVLPTTFEGCSNVLVETMAKGLPIITNDIPSVCWMFKNGESALLCKKNDVIDLSKKLHLLIINKNLRIRLGKNALIRFHNHFTSQIMIDKIDQIYKKLL